MKLRFLIGSQQKEEKMSVGKAAFDSFLDAKKIVQFFRQRTAQTQKSRVVYPLMNILLRLVISKSPKIIKHVA